MFHFCDTDFFPAAEYVTVQQGGGVLPQAATVVCFVYMGLATVVTAVKLTSPGSGATQVLLAWIMNSTPAGSAAVG